MSTKSPIKNVFLTLYLLNNTFNENLLYDQETGMKQLSSNSHLETQTDLGRQEQGIASIHKKPLRPLLQIPSSCNYNYTAEIKDNCSKGANLKLPNRGKLLMYLLLEP